ncbi:MAG: hypothetical protein H7X71_02595 [Chitinophagales bacterium]|nr:hypothetical protein [Chitinophagales bacterium]
MKKIKSLLCVFFLLISCIAFGQKKVEVTERNTTMSLGARSGYSVTFEDMDKKELKSRFEDFVEQYGKKVSLDEVTKTEYIVNDVIVTSISEQPIDIYLLFEETNSGTVITGFFDTGDMFISSATQPQKYSEAENFMRRFAWRVEKIKIQERLNITQKLLDRKQDEKQDLERRKQTLEEDIVDCTKTIENAKNDIQQNEKDQEGKKTEIADQQKSLNDINDELKAYENY